jgi:pantoate--beta-alanine ligase
MGYLHAGHASLAVRARQIVGPKGVVVASIYVNPTQFAPTEDLARYPRDLKRDKCICKEASVDVLFVPQDRQMYPQNDGVPYSTFITEEFLSQGMEGASRPTHFRGVATVVAKLFHIVLPDIAVFGAKDYQQAAVIKKMTSDLNFAVRIVVAPTQREPDGLAMSSRNKYLSPDERAQASALSQAIRRARELAAGSKNGIKASEAIETLSKEITKINSARVDYISFFNPKTLLPADHVCKGVHMAVAVYIGKTRLIDNGRI